jgi:hypothetical protein
VTGGSKLDPRSIQCRFLGYGTGTENYKVQDLDTRRVFISRDLVFEEGLPHRTLASVGEQQIPILDTMTDFPLTNTDDDTNVAVPDDPDIPVVTVPVDIPAITFDQPHIPGISVEPR